MKKSWRGWKFRWSCQSDLDLDVLSAGEEFDSKDEGDHTDSEWSEEFEDFQPKPFDPANSGIKVLIPDGSGALFFFILLF